MRRETKNFLNEDAQGDEIGTDYTVLHPKLCRHHRRSIASLIVLSITGRMVVHNITVCSMSRSIDSGDKLSYIN